MLRTLSQLWQDRCQYTWPGRTAKGKRTDLKCVSGEVLSLMAAWCAWRCESLLISSLTGLSSAVSLVRMASSRGVFDVDVDIWRSGE